MPSLISHFPKKEQQSLLDDLNYLNMDEILGFCRKHSIPFKILFADVDGKIKSSKDKDRKGVVADRIRHYLKTGKVLPATCFPKTVVRSLDDSPKVIKRSSRLYYGHYDKKNKKALEFLQTLTNGKFKDGAVARIILREYWSSGRAPTYREFASAWLEATAENKTSHPEWAFLADLKSGRAGDDWKTKRNKIAKGVLQILNKIEAA